MGGAERCELRQEGVGGAEAGGGGRCELRQEGVGDVS